MQRRLETSTIMPQQMGPKGVKSGGKDDAFYSSLAAMADTDDGSDISEADVNKLAYSLGHLDDMDADLFGGALKKKVSPGQSSANPTTPRHNTPRSNMTKSPSRIQSPTQGDVVASPPGSARTGLKRKPVKPPSPTAASSNPPVFSPRQVQPEPKPGTAPGKMTDLSSATKSMAPGQQTQQRPETAPKVRKKPDFGDFDPDDPLAGILSENDEDVISESNRSKSVAKNSAKVPGSQPKVLQKEIVPEIKPSPHVQSDSPRRRTLMDRPPTRSGNSLGDNEPAAANAVADVDSNAEQPAAKAQAGIFSDSDDLLDGLGLEDKNTTPAKQMESSQKAKAGNGEEVLPARSVFDSLLGRGSTTAAQLLERKEKKEFVLDSKYSSSFAGSAGARDADDDFQFGSYQPSAASSSRPNSRRSVRFQDDDIFGPETRPLPGQKSSDVKKAPSDMDWLEAAAKTNVPTASKTASALDAEDKPIASKMSTTTLQKPTESSSKAESGGNEKDSSGAANSGRPSSAGQNPRAWLGLEDSGSDDELFKPRKSSTRSASLPQSPAVSSASASPRIFPKKPPKKASTPTKVSPPISLNKDDDDDDDDWLARAKNRRQQMLAKEEGKESVDSTFVGKTEALGSEGTAEEKTIKVDIANLNLDVPKFGGSARTDVSSDLFSVPQSGTPREAVWESSKTAQSVAVSSERFLGGQASPAVHSGQQNLLSDPRLKYSAALLRQEQPPAAPALNDQSRILTVSTQPEKEHRQQLQIQQDLFQQQQQHHPHIQDPEQPQHQLKSVPGVQSLHGPAFRDQSQTFSVPVPAYSQVMSSGKLPDSLPEAQSVIKKLELEKNYTESLLESTRRRYEEELFGLETSYKNRLQFIEDSNRRREARLREENEELMQQHLAKLRQVEQEKSDLTASHYRRLEDLERDRAVDLEKLREQHRLALASLKREHEEALEQLASSKNKEINLVANANDTSRNLTAAVQQIQNNARDLGELQMKIETWNKQGLDEREVSLRSKDEQLRILQEKLNRQAEDNEKERKRLEGLISHMESQLKEQTRTLEEERWKLKQDQIRAEALQRSLEEERRMWLEQQTRERINMERARESYLEEQNRSVAQIAEERRMLSEERTKFHIEQKTVREKLHQDAIKRSQAEADYEVLMRTVSEEKALQAARRQELQREEERISAERNGVERERSKLEQDQEKLATQAHQIREQSEQIDRVTETARRSQQEGEQALEEAMQYRAQIERKDAEVQKQLNGFKQIEEHISEEKLRLAKEKKDVENLKNSALCANCRSPLHGSSVPLQNGHHTPHLTSLGPPSAQRVHLTSSAHQFGTNPLDRIAFSIANDRAVRMLKIQAIKDKEFLEEENIYLEGLRHAPYHSTTTASKS